MLRCSAGAYLRVMFPTFRSASAFRPLVRLPSLAVLPALVGGCNMVVMNPMGDVALQQRNLVIFATALMLLIVIPVIALVGIFAWRYRASNTAARYEPDWDHSTQLELIVWSAPLLIIICLGAITWVGTHLLDPYRPIERISSGEPIKSGTESLEVQVVALDWKWLFIYPQLGIATINELAAPVNKPINFKITSSSVMNSFYVPALAGQIYAMPGMETKLHGVINKAGNYDGFSANYSGAGFSGMRFRFHGYSDEEFAAWTARVKRDPSVMNRDEYLRLERPTEKEPARFYGQIDPELYKAALNMCVQPGKMCMDEMTRIDANGGLGMAGINNTLPLDYDKYARRGSSPSFVAAVCSAPDPAVAALIEKPSLTIWPRNPASLVGAGLVRPRSASPRTFRTADLGMGDN